MEREHNNAKHTEKVVTKFGISSGKFCDVIYNLRLQILIWVKSRT